MRFTLEPNFDKQQVFTLSLCIVFLGFIVLLCCSPLICQIEVLRPYLKIFYAYYFFVVLFNVLQQFLKGLNSIKAYVISGIINTIINIGLNIVLLIVLKRGIYGYLVAFVGGYAVSCVYMIFCEKMWLFLTPISKLDLGLVKSFLCFCIPLIPNSLSWWISNSSDKYILTFFEGAAVTGVYSVAYKIPSLMAVLSNIFTSAWQISAVDDFGSEESIAFFSDIYNKYSSLYVLITSAIILGIKLIAEIMFSKNFYNAWSFATVLIIASMFQAMCSFLGSIYTTAMKTRMIFITTFIGAIFNIVLNFILIPRIGAYGAAIATLVSYFSVWLIRIIDSRKIIRLNISIKKDIVVYIILVVQCVVVCVNRYWSLIVSFILCIMVLILNQKFVVSLFRIVKIKVRANISNRRS